MNGTCRLSGKKVLYSVGQFGNQDVVSCLLISKKQRLVGSVTVPA